MTLKGTECYHEIQNILAAGISAHLILITAPVVLLFKKAKEKKSIVFDQ